MSTFIRGVPGIIELITIDRDELQRTWHKPGLKKSSKLRIEVEIGALNSVLGTLKTITVLPEPAYDALFGKPS